MKQSIWGVAEAVSYTHLDVYKRQTIVLAFHTCRRIYKEGWLLGIWKKLGYFKAPTEAQIWTMACLLYTSRCV